MKLHPRTVAVKHAALEIGQMVNTTVKNYELTYGELMRILAQELDSWARYLVRDERHPNEPDKKGDEA